MEIAFWPAVFAGLVAGSLMLVLRQFIRDVLDIDLYIYIPRLWGTMLKVHGAAGLVLGLMMHLLVSAGIALVFAWIFSALGITDNFFIWGLVLGLALWVIAGLFMAIVPFMHPEIPEKRPAPGAFAHNFGSTEVVVFMISQLFYGVVVSLLYLSFI